MSFMPVLRRVPECERPTLSTYSDGDAARPAVESFIRSVYARRFGAELLHFAPTLVSLRDERRRCSLPPATAARRTGRLFLETYLEAPIERVLAAHHGAAPRARASSRSAIWLPHVPGEGRRLIRLLARIWPHWAFSGWWAR